MKNYHRFFMPSFLFRKPILADHYPLPIAAPFIASVVAGNLAKAQLLQSHAPAVVNHGALLNGVSRFPLSVALERGDDPMIRFLLTQGASTRLIEHRYILNTIATLSTTMDSVPGAIKLYTGALKTELTLRHQQETSVLRLTQVISDAVADQDIDELTRLVSTPAFQGFLNIPICNARYYHTESATVVEGIPSFLSLRDFLMKTCGELPVNSAACFKHLSAPLRMTDARMTLPM